jgi:hypothetical protein
MFRKSLVLATAMLAMITVLAMSPLACAGDKTLTFGWEQTMPVTGWNLYMSVLPGTYNDPPVLTVVYDGNPLNEYTADTIITSPDGESHTYYFVLTSYDEADPVNESGYSNEVSQVIDFEAPGVPFSLTVTIKATP